MCHLTAFLLIIIVFILLWALHIMEPLKNQDLSSTDVYLCNLHERMEGNERGGQE